MADRQPTVARSTLSRPARLLFDHLLQTGTTRSTRSLLRLPGRTPTPNTSKAWLRCDMRRPERSSKFQLIKDSPPALLLTHLVKIFKAIKANLYRPDGRELLQHRLYSLPEPEGG